MGAGSFGTDREPLRDCLVVESLGQRNENLTSRTSYVIAPDGEIVLVHSDNDWSQHVSRTLAAVQSLRSS